MKRLAHLLMWALIVLVILLSTLNLLLIVRINEQQNEKLIQQSINVSDAEKRINQHIDSLENSMKPVQVKDGYTPKKGVDYFDGKNGKDGVDGKDGTNGVDGKDGKDGTNGQDGLTPTLRCNTTKNRWEVKYSDTDTWKILNNQPVKCTIDS